MSNREYKSEAIKNMTIDMTFETRQKLFTKEAFEDGKAEGIEEGKKEGKKEGEKLGKVIALYSLVTDELITLDDAVKRSGLTKKEFMRYVQQ